MTELPKPGSPDESIGEQNNGLNWDGGLVADALNAWSALSPMFITVFPSEKINPVQRYEEYFGDKSLENPGELTVVMSKSNPVHVKAFNDLVNEFNANLEKIKKDRDKKALENFFYRAHALVYGPSESLRESTDSHFNKLHTLNTDVANAWARAALEARSLRNMENFDPIKSYEEYFRLQDKNFPGIYLYVMKKSDPNAVAELNALASSLNSELPRIMTENDHNAIEDYYDKAHKLIFGSAESNLI